MFLILIQLYHFHYVYLIKNYWIDFHYINLLYSINKAERFQVLNSVFVLIFCLQPTRVCFIIIKAIVGYEAAAACLLHLKSNLIRFSFIMCQRRNFVFKSFFAIIGPVKQLYGKSARHAKINYLPTYAAIPMNTISLVMVPKAYSMKNKSEIGVPENKFLKLR